MKHRACGTRLWVVAGLFLVFLALSLPAQADMVDSSQRFTYAVVSGGVRITYFWGSDTDLTLPTELDGKKVVSIGGNAFSGLCKVERLTVPASVTDFAKGAFSGSSLKSLTIQGNVAKLENFFTFGTSLESLTIQGNVGSIVNIVGAKDTLKTVTINGNVTSIERSAFSNATALEAFTVRGTVSTMKDSAFFYATSLRTVRIGGGLTAVPNGAFRGCSLLEVCELGSAVTSVGSNAFRDCVSLSGLSFSKGLTSIGESAFRDCVGLTAFAAGGAQTVGKNAFNGCTAMTSVTLTGNVTTLGENAFASCGPNLELTIQGNVGTIGKGLASSLKSLEITGNVDKISASAFSNSPGPETLHIGGKLGSLGIQAFSFATRLRSVRIDGGIGTIDGAVATSGLIASTFARCTSLEEFVVGGNIDTLGDSMFLGCTSLTTVSIGGTLKGVGRAAFQNCTSLKSFSYQGALSSIGEDAFNGCLSLTRVSLASGLTALPARCFYQCRALTSLDVPDSVTSLVFPVCGTSTELVVGANSAAYRYAAGIPQQTYRIRGTNTYHKGETCATSEDKAKQIVAEVIRPGMSDYDKALALHDYLVAHVTYDNSTRTFSGSMDSALLFGTAVCQGYCYAYQLLLSLVGIPCEIEDNPAENHAWNVVYIGGAWYHVDVTWDDGSGSYAFFMVPSAALRGVEAHDKANYTHPAESYANNYYYRNGLLTKAISRVATEVQSALNSGKTSFTFSMNEKDLPYGTRHQTALLAAFDQNTFTRGGKPCQLSYTYNVKTAQVTVNVTNSASRSGGTLFVLRGDSFTLPSPLAAGKSGTVTWHLEQDDYLPALQGSTVDANGRVTITSNYTAGDAPLYAWLVADITYTDGTKESVTYYVGYTEHNPQPTLNLPSSLTRVKDETFMYSSYERVVLGENVQSVGKRAFAENLSLRSVVVQGMNTVIDDTAFDLASGEITFYVRSGSKAEAWAKKNGVRYALLSK